MNKTLLKGLETFLIGLGVVVVSTVIQALTNYHPTGMDGTIWGVVGVAIIGGLRALLSWLIVKQQAPVPPIPVPLPTPTSSTGA